GFLQKLYALRLLPPRRRKARKLLESSVLSKETPSHIQCNELAQSRNPACPCRHRELFFRTSGKPLWSVSHTGAIVLVVLRLRLKSFVDDVAIQADLGNVVSGNPFAIT